MRTFSFGALTAATTLAGLLAFTPALGAPVDEDDAAASSRALGAASHSRPWIEGVDPGFENRLFWNTYYLLPEHNVLKVYAFSAGGYESAGIRFSARVPHERRDLSIDEMSREAAMLVRMTFDRYPGVQNVDVWGTIPVPQSQAAAEESTVFSVSADRSTYDDVRDEPISDLAFLKALGHLWIAPQVPQ